MICLISGQTACEWDSIINGEDLWNNYKRLVKHNGAVVLFASGAFVYYLIQSNLAWYKYSWYWDRGHSTRFIQCNNMPLSRIEQLLVFSESNVLHKKTGDRNNEADRMIYNPQGLIPYNKPIKNYNNKFGTIVRDAPNLQKESNIRKYRNYPCDLLTFKAPPCNGREHTNEKPVSLLSYIIQTYTSRGNTVLDNAMGSGSTGEAALMCGRRFIGIEKDEAIFSRAKKRIEGIKNIFCGGEC